MPPPHGNLRGRDIGMFYANRSKHTRKKKENENRAHVLMSHNQRAKIDVTLSEVQALRSDKSNASTSLGAGSSRSSASSFEVERLPFENRVNDEQINEALKLELLAKQESDIKYQKMLESRQNLPAFKMRNDILKAIDENQVCVISGETGCGKTTQVPQLVLDYKIRKGTGSQCRIICTQPRRISAISIAQRVAEERSEPLGRSTGYSIRVEHKLPRDEGSIVYCTTGMLLRWIHFDPDLVRASHIVLDEVHERSAHSDVLLVLLKRLLATNRRPDLKILLMSATLNAEEISSYFGDCCTLNIPGFTFPVTEFFLEDVLQLSGYEPNNNQSQWRRKRPDPGEQEIRDALNVAVRNLGSKYNQGTRHALMTMDQEAFDEEMICHLISFICRTQGEGAILVFVPGWEQIRKVVDLLAQNGFSDHNLVLPLHSLMPTAEQGAIFNRPPPGVRKVIVSTAIAETSITIDDVVFVIDCGKTKEANYDVKKNVKTLQPEWVSLASAKQRRGRAGRVQKGYCFHLYMQARENFLLKYQIPELLRMSLESIILELIKIDVGNIPQFFSDCLSQPTKECVDQSIRELQQMNAITFDIKLTPLGHHLAMLPVEPRIGKFILYGSIFSCLDPVLTIAACFSHKDPFVVPLDKERQVKQAKQSFSAELSDPLVYANALYNYEKMLRDGRGRQLDAFCWDSFLSKSTLKFILDMKKQFAEYLQKEGFIHGTDYRNQKYNKYSQCDMVLKAMVVAGFYPSIIKVDNFGKRSRFRPLFSNYGKVDIHMKSVAADIPRVSYNYMVNYMRVKSLGGVNLYDVSPAHPYALMLFGSDVKKSHDDNGAPLIVIDKDISFRCDPQLADTIIGLSQELSNLLEAKIARRSQNQSIDLQQLQETLTKAVVDLIMGDQDI